DKLRHEIGGDIRTLPQIILRKDALVDILKENLANLDNRALDAVLELTVALARDLQRDFYVYFPDILRLVCGHLATQDTDILERLFVCLAYLFKFLWRYMVEDIDAVFGLYVPLLGSQQKKYVRDFASESFAFLLRKVPDKQKLLDMMLTQLETNPQYADGIGRLLYEAVKGVKGQTHSCLAAVLSPALRRLDGSVGSVELSRQVLCTALGSLAGHLCGQPASSSAPVWQCLLDAVEKSVGQVAGGGDSTLLESLGATVRVWMDFRGGALLRGSSLAPQILEAALSVGEVSAALTTDLLACVATLLKTCGVATATSGAVSGLVEKARIVFSGCFSPAAVFDFTTDVLDYSLFEKVVLAPLVRYASELQDESDALALLARVVLQRRPVDLARLEGFGSLLPLDNRCSAVAALSGLVARTLSLDVSASPARVWAGLVCLPHFASLAGEEELKRLLPPLVSTLRDRLATGQPGPLSLLLAQVMSSAALCNLGDVLTSCIGCQDLVQLLRLCPDDPNILRAARVHLRHLRDMGGLEDRSERLLADFYGPLELNLASPYAQVRLLTLQILTCLAAVDAGADDERGEAWSASYVFDVCLRAEEVPLTVQEYREKLKQLAKLNAEQLAAAGVFLERYSMAPVLYLLGMLLVNFQVLWKPVQEILASHASADGPFWGTFSGHLVRIYDTIENPGSSKASLELLGGTADSRLQRLLEQVAESSSPTDHPDYVNHRHLLWEAAGQFAGVAERRNKDVVALFYRFLEREFWPNTQTAPHHSILKADNSLTLPGKEEEPPPRDADEESVVIVEEEDARVPHDKENDEQRGSASRAAPKAKLKLVRSLCDHLGVLAKFNNPKALTKSERLYQTYLDLLAFRDCQVQKLAFACIVSYGHKFLLPYKEHFERLLDEGSFRSELLLFNVDDGEEGALHADHRPEVIPVLMRVLYGKMHMRSGSATGGKGSFSARQGAVLRFLANCRQDELAAFVHLEVVTLRDYLQDNILAMVGKIQATLDLAKVVPIRRLHGTLGTVENVVRHLGALSPSLLPTLLKLMVAVTAYAGAILRHKDRVVRPLVAATRALRAQGLKMITQFSADFELNLDGHLSGVSLCICLPSHTGSLQLPIVEELGGKQFPTPLLKFFLALSRNPRYFVLFSKFNKDDPGTSALPLMVALLGNSNVSPAIVRTLLTIVDNLLSLNVEDEGDSADEGPKAARPLSINHCFDVSARHSSAPESGALSYGSLLVLPYVPHILKRLRLVVEAALRTHKPVSAVEMDILSRISEHLTDPTQCSELARLFLAGFKKLHSPAPEAEQQKLTTVLNLTKAAENPERLLGFAAPLFASLGNRHSRRLLCEVYSALAERVPRYAELATFVNKVNSWNRRFAEEPDYQARLEGFRMAAALLDQYKDAPDVPLVLSVVYNCTFTIRAVDDLAVRDAASLALSDAMPVFGAWLSDNPAAYKACVSEALMREVKRGLRSKEEPSRHEFVRVLSLLLRHCGQHPSLSGLATLCCQEDPELDLWDNLCHIQVHRRCRALTRLAASLRAGELVELGAAPLSDVVLPLTSCFVLNPAYAKQSALVDAAIDLMGAVCGRLPWRPYEALLSRYLQQLQRDTEHHKMAIRLVVAILEAFHFDLSKSRGVRGTPSKLAEEAAPSTKSSQAGSIAEGMAGEPAEAADAEMDYEAEAAEGRSALVFGPGCAEPVPAVAEEAEAQATAIHTAIATRLLPRLHRVLAQKARSDDEHRAAKSAYPEDTEILRIPIAVAMVKLLQALPGDTLQRHLPSVLLRICEFLKSRSGDIREAARGTLCKVMSLLGAPYLGYLLREMKSLLKRGYQVHVLTYTTHAVLDSLSASLQPGDLDSCAQDIVCQTELFTDMAEEKEVAQIGAKVKEAKATKSFRIYQLLGAFASQDSLAGLTGPLCEVLLSTSSHKTVRKCEDCLHHLCLGLSSNQGLPISALLVHIHRLVADSSSQLGSSPGERVAPPKLLTKREDVFLIPREPSRDGLPVHTSKKTNAHVLVEFGLKLLQGVLKRERVSANDKSHLEMLDPFVPLLTQLVDSSYVKVVSTSLRCFVRLLRMPLPSLGSHVQRLGRSLFVLLHRHTGMKQGDNLELLMLAFKVVTVLVKEASLFPLETPQLLVLLSYVERDVHDHSRQSIAFALLKALLLRRVEADEVHELMEKVATMSIVDERAHVRAQCREAYLQYVLDYPMKRRMKNVVGFFTAQLEFPLETGRLSALEMLHAYSAKFPQRTLAHYSGTLFVSVAARLVNDASASVRRVAAAALRSLLEKLDDNGRSSLFSVALAWCGEKMLATRRLAAQVVGLFAEVEGDKFSRHLPALLPVLVEQMHPDRFQESAAADVERTKDHMAYLYLVSLSKAAMACPLARDPNSQGHLGTLCGYALEFLLHPHTWVRLAAAQLYGALFAAYQPEEVAQACRVVGDAPDYLLEESALKVRRLVEAFCSQMQAPQVSSELAEQVVRNLVFLTKVCVRVERTGTQCGLPSVDWLLRKMAREAQREVATDPHCTLKRSHVLKFLAAVALDLSREELKGRLETILRPVCRELEDRSPSHSEELKALAQEVSSVLKKAAGVEALGSALVAVQAQLSGKKFQRKRTKAHEAVSNPEASARKRMRRQLVKKEALKRRLAIRAGKKPKKKRKLA
ncbi:unnamed protein product, partial [Ixodes hexagonus]